MSGPPRPAPAPLASLPAPAATTGPISRRREITFAVGMGGGMGMSFTIDGRTFDPRRDDQTVALGLGGIEEWTITNTSPMDHPFHLHTWLFTLTANRRS
jgi:FtsP/CotA-like multicopper oxidase with cupredoxin domain